MNLTLPPDVQSIIDRRIESGQFASSEDVIAEAVRQMDDLAVPDELLATAMAQAERGEGLPLTEAVMRELLERSRANAGSGHKVRDEVQY